MGAVRTSETFYISELYEEQYIRVEYRSTDAACIAVRTLCFEMQLGTVMLLFPCGLCGSGGLPE